MLRVTLYKVQLTSSFRQNNIGSLKLKGEPSTVRGTSGSLISDTEYNAYCSKNGLTSSTCHIRNCLDMFSTHIGLKPSLDSKCNDNVQFQMEIPKISPGHITLLFCEDGKGIQIYNARAQLLFCSLTFCLVAFLVAVAVVVCLGFPDDTREFYQTTTATATRNVTKQKV